MQLRLSARKSGNGFEALNLRTVAAKHGGVAALAALWLVAPSALAAGIPLASIHVRDPFREDGGHAMIFRRFDGALMVALHSPNRSPDERCRLIEVEDTGNTLGRGGKSL